MTTTNETYTRGLATYSVIRGKNNQFYLNIFTKFCDGSVLNESFRIIDAKDDEKAHVSMKYIGTLLLKSDKNILALLQKSRLA